MEKSHDALKTIGEMSKALGVQPHILRYWEEQFSILNPLKRAGGRRYYRSEDAVLLHEIHRLIYAEGFTIKGAQKYLLDHKKSTKAPGKTSVASAASLMSAEPSRSEHNGSVNDDIYRKLEHIADGLRNALAT